jgi:dihydroxy-acid dehydratase
VPEWGAAPIPARLLRKGVKDMVRISDAGMSGTSYETFTWRRRAAWRPRAAHFERGYGRLFLEHVLQANER